MTGGMRGESEENFHLRTCVSTDRWAKCIWAAGCQCVWAFGRFSQDGHWGAVNLRARERRSSLPVLNKILPKQNIGHAQQPVAPGVECKCECKCESHSGIHYAVHIVWSNSLSRNLVLMPYGHTTFECSNFECSNAVLMLQKAASRLYLELWILAKMAGDGLMASNESLVMKSAEWYRSELLIQKLSGNRQSAVIICLRSTINLDIQTLDIPSLNNRRPDCAAAL